jgi:hypothetical protein
MQFQILSKIVVLGLAIWAIYAIVSALMGVTIYFPLRMSEGQEIPYHRWQSVRVSVFMTFIYFAVLHLANASREMYPIKFLQVYLAMLTVSGLVVFIREGVDVAEYLLVIFFGFCTLVLYLASRPKFRRYFSKS